MGIYDFTVHIEFDWLMNYPDAREFQDHLGSTFAIPPFVTFGMTVDPPIHTSEREIDIGLRYGVAETTAIRVEGRLQATAPGIARALLRRSCEALWWHSHCRRRMQAELDGTAFVIDLTIPAAHPSALPPSADPRKLAGYPPKAFVAHRWSSIPEMADATVTAVALSACGYDVAMDQLDTRGTYVERVNEQAISEYVAQIAACHLFLYVSTDEYENDAERKWLAEERRVALQEAAELRIRLAAVVMHDTLAPADRFADVIVDGRSALCGTRTTSDSRAGDTREMQSRLLEAGLGYAGPVVDPALQACLAETVETATSDIRRGRLREADRTLSSTRDALGATEEWRLSSAKLLAASGEQRDAAVLASTLLKAPAVQYQTKLDACDVLEGIGLARLALRESARILRIFLSPSRAELRAISHTYARVRESMARLLAGMGEYEGAQAHAAVAAQPSPPGIPPEQRERLACDWCPARYTPGRDAASVVCEACGGHGAFAANGCIFCGSKRRFTCDRVSSGRACPICGVGSVRWSCSVRWS